MADDCSNHLVSIEVENQEELEAYLRGYLPYAYKKRVLGMDNLQVLQNKKHSISLLLLDTYYKLFR